MNNIYNNIKEDNLVMARRIKNFPIAENQFEGLLALLVIII